MRSLHTATKSSPCWPQLEKARAQQQRPNTAKNKINKINKNLKNDIIPRLSIAIWGNALVKDFEKNVKDIFSPFLTFLWKYNIYTEKYTNQKWGD